MSPEALAHPRDPILIKLCSFEKNKNIACIVNLVETRPNSSYLVWCRPKLVETRRNSSKLIETLANSLKLERVRERERDGERAEGVREKEICPIYSIHLYTFSYTFIYFDIPSNTRKYLYISFIPSHTSKYPILGK